VRRGLQHRLRRADLAARPRRRDQPADRRIGRASHAERRAGDIQHSLAEIGKARRLLGYEPRVAWRKGSPARSSSSALRMGRERVTRGPDHAVIIAGAGTRLWPWTGPGLPKPLLPLGGGGRTLLAAVLDRLAGLVPPDAVALQAPRRSARASRPPSRAWRGAPSSGNERARHGPAIALAMRRLLAAAPEAVVAVLPADQRVADEPAFRAALAAAAETARGGALVTLGVVPDHASTRFGYIEAGGPLGGGSARGVARFVEKPDRATAERFLAGGRHLWNAGSSSGAPTRSGARWNAPPRAGRPIARVVDGDAAAWEAAPRTSIDYALMERTEGVAVVPLDAGWDDVGGWDAVIRLAHAGTPGRRASCRRRVRRRTARS